MHSVLSWRLCCTSAWPVYPVWELHSVIAWCWQYVVYISACWTENPWWSEVTISSTDRTTFTAWKMLCWVCIVTKHKRVLWRSQWRDGVCWRFAGCWHWLRASSCRSHFTMYSLLHLYPTALFEKKVHQLQQGLSRNKPQAEQISKLT